MPIESESGTKLKWRNVPRAELPKRSVEERVADFLEVYSDLDEATVQQQAARCIQCPDPPCVPAPIEAAPVGEASTPPTSAAAAFEIEADVVIVAFGFDRVPCRPGCGLDELDANAQGYLATHANGMTSLPGVFAGGDLVHGPGQLVETVREARRAARGIHAWLQPAPGIPHG
jgi:NADPH-dependent glutamate synthase beta subunit-like oxidoreductase